MRGPKLEHLRQELRDPARGGGYRRVAEHAGHDRAPVSGGRAVRANSPAEVLAGMRTTLGGGSGGCLGGMFRCGDQRGGCRGWAGVARVLGGCWGAAQATGSTASQGAAAMAMGVAPVKALTSRWRWDWSA